MTRSPAAQGGLRPRGSAPAAGRAIAHGLARHRRQLGCCSTQSRHLCNRVAGWPLARPPTCPCSPLTVHLSQRPRWASQVSPALLRTASASTRRPDMGAYLSQPGAPCCAMAAACAACGSTGRASCSSKQGVPWRARRVPQPSDACALHADTNPQPAAPAVVSKERFEGEGADLQYGGGAMQGWRRTMEDAHIAEVGQGLHSPQPAGARSTLVSQATRSACWLQLCMHGAASLPGWLTPRAPPPSRRHRNPLFLVHCLAAGRPCRRRDVCHVWRV